MLGKLIKVGGEILFGEEVFELDGLAKIDLGVGFLGNFLLMSGGTDLKERLVESFVLMIFERNGMEVVGQDIFLDDDMGMVLGLVIENKLEIDNVSELGKESTLTDVM